LASISFNLIAAYACDAAGFSLLFLFVKLHSKLGKVEFLAGRIIESQWGERECTKREGTAFVSLFENRDFRSCL
jgi:hypothetical protein